METIHTTVLLNETIDALNLKKGMTVVDATLGGGGHAIEVLKQIGSEGTLIAFDRDQKAIDRFKKRIASMPELHNRRIIFCNDNYALLKERLSENDITSVDAIYADLGISSDQLADRERGISFQIDAPLDMRMDQREELTAEKIINEYDQAQLEDILRTYGGEQYARSIVRSIIAARSEKRITRTLQLVEIIEQSVPGAYRRKKTHPATKTFQALRIEVNQELESLRSFLSQAIELLASNGRIAIITFHSGEDALVKQVFRENARGCICPPEFPVCRCGKKPKISLVTRRPIMPSDHEIEENPRARSAQLRVAEKTH